MTATNGAEARSPWRSALSLPESFVSLDLSVDPDTDRSSIEELVAAHLAARSASDDRAIRGQLVEGAVQTLRTARSHDAIAAAIAADVIDGFAVEAYVLMFWAGAQDSQALDTLARSLGERSRRAVGHRRVDVLELDGRPAVRYAGFALVDPDADASPIVAERAYVVPVPGTGLQYVLLCWTPHVDAADEMGELFDAIADGLEITAGPRVSTPAVAP